MRKAIQVLILLVIAAVAALGQAPAQCRVTKTFYTLAGQPDRFATVTLFEIRLGGVGVPAYSTGRAVFKTDSQGRLLGADGVTIGVDLPQGAIVKLYSGANAQLPNLAANPNAGTQYQVPNKSTANLEELTWQLATIKQKGALLIGGVNGIASQFTPCPEGQILVWEAAQALGTKCATLTAALGYTPVNKVGDTMTGALTLSGAPTLANHAATKGYVDGLATMQSFAGRTGAVTPQSGDYSFAQIGSKPTTLAGYGILDAVPSLRAIICGAGLSGCGDLSADRTLVVGGLADSQIAAGAGIAQSKIANLTSDLAAKEPLLGFTAVPNTRAINCGTGLTGCGSLAADRTISVNSASVAFSTAIPFNRLFTYLGQQTIASNLTFTKDTTGAFPGAQAAVRLMANGSHTITYSQFKETIGSAGYDNRSGIVNVLTFFFDGADYWITIFQELNAIPTDIVAPTLSSAIVSNSVKNRIVLTYNEALDSGSVPAIGAFTVSGGKTVSSVTVSGTTVNVNVNSDYAYGDTITISYTAGGSPIQDVAGNDAANLSSQSVTNNINPPDSTPPTLSNAVVADATPTQIVLTYNEALDTGSVPATGAFSVSGGKSVTNVAVSGSAVTVTVNTAYAYGDTITISYTAGGSPIQDVAGNDAANLSSQAVTNNIQQPLNNLAMTDLVNITDNGDNTFTGTVAFPTVARMRGAKKFAGDFILQWEHSFGSGISAFVGLDATNAIVTYNDSDYGNNNGGSGVNVYRFQNGSGTDTGITVADGNLLRWKRTGTSLALEKSTTAGASWTTIHTFSSVSGDLYVYVQLFQLGASNESGKFYFPKESGGTTP